MPASFTMLPPDESSVVLCPESRGGFCYYDSALGTASWLAPQGSRPLETLLKGAVLDLPREPPPPPPRNLGLGSMFPQLSGWIALFRDADNSVHFAHTATGAVREAPWLVLRTPGGVAYFCNLISRESRWLPPPLWMQGFISRRPYARLQGADRYDILRGADRTFFTTIDQRAPLVGMLGRERVEGGAPYLLEGGKPQYSPDAFDTPHTYPLEGYVEVECLRNEFDEMCWKLASEYSGVRPSRIGYVDGWCRPQPPTACIAAPPAAEPLTISSFAAEASSTPAQAPCASNRERRAAIVIESGTGYTTWIS